MTRPLEIGLERAAVPGVVVARLGGELDLSSAGVARRALTAATGRDDAGLVLDLTAVEYVDSAGCRLLFELNDLLHGRSQRLALVVPEPSPVRRTLLIVAIDVVAPVASSLGEALAGFGPSRGRVASH